MGHCTRYPLITLFDELLILLYVVFVVITMRSFTHSRFIIGFVTRVTRRTGATCGAGIDYPSGAPEYTSDFYSEFVLPDP